MRNKTTPHFTSLIFDVLLLILIFLPLQNQGISGLIKKAQNFKVQKFKSFASQTLFELDCKEEHCHGRFFHFIHAKVRPHFSIDVSEVGLLTGKGQNICIANIRAQKTSLKTTLT